MTFDLTPWRWSAYWCPRGVADAFFVKRGDTVLRVATEIDGAEICLEAVMVTNAQNPLLQAPRAPGVQTVSYDGSPEYGLLTAPGGGLFYARARARLTIEFALAIARTLNALTGNSIAVPSVEYTNARLAP